MHKFLKSLNKFNGNICFAGTTDFGQYIFECDRNNRVVSYASSTKSITDICLMSANSYSVAFSDQYIGKYSGGVLDDDFIPTGLSNVDKIVINTGSTVVLISLTT